MAFAIGAVDLAVRIDHRQRVVEMRAVALEKACRNGNAKLLGQFHHRLYGWMVLRRPGQCEMRLFLRLAEIRAGEQLGRQDDLRALCRCLADKIRHCVDILRFIAGKVAVASAATVILRVMRRL